MTAERREPFELALDDVRERLREGRLSPGARVVARDVADRLKLSTTPVREALSRLAGQGLLDDRRGEGFFVPGLAATDIADLYRLSESILNLAQAAGRPSYRDLARPMALGEDADPVRSVESLFATWVAESGGRILREHFRIVALRIAPVRRLEDQLLSDLRQEASALLAMADTARRGDRRTALEAFHGRRILLAEQMAHLLDPEQSSQV